jgi:hypothetical protein
LHSYPIGHGEAGVQVGRIGFAAKTAPTSPNAATNNTKLRNFMNNNSFINFKKLQLIVITTTNHFNKKKGVKSRHYTFNDELLMYNV